MESIEVNEVSDGYRLNCGESTSKQRLAINMEKALVNKDSFFIQIK